MVDGPRRQAAGTVPAARLEGLRVDCRDLVRPQLGEDGLAEQRNEVLSRDLPVALICARRDARLDVGEPVVEKGAEPGLGGLDVGALGELRDETRALDLRLSLGSGERVPFAFALVGLGIADVENDGPMAG